MEIEILRISENSDQPVVPVYSTTNVMTLRFITDARYTARGFLASVSASSGVYVMAGISLLAR